MYHSGADYDAHFAARYEPDIRYFTALADRIRGSILDICCGTGIITIPLAELGYETVGVDISPAMLSHARSKAPHLTNLLLLNEDALTFQLGRRFDLALMTGNSFQQFHTDGDVRTLLHNLYLHLREGATFVFDTRLLDGSDVSTTEEYELWESYLGAAGQEVTAHFKQRFDPTRRLLTYDFKDVYEDGGVQYAQETLRFMTLDEVERLLAEMGFTIVARYGDWEYTPFAAGDPYVVFELTKRSGPRIR